MAAIVIMHISFSSRLFILILTALGVFILKSYFVRFGCMATDPSYQPTIYLPSNKPTTQPTAQPLIEPTSQPSLETWIKPSQQPSIQPTQYPSTKPTYTPSIQPTFQPLKQPSRQPQSVPSIQPHSHPSSCPSLQPLYKPTRQPSQQPRTQPTIFPSSQSFHTPTQQPNHKPSNQPSNRPSHRPSFQPTHKPSSQPTIIPSHQPNSYPSHHPTTSPSLQPVIPPTKQPTYQPLFRPSQEPSIQPTKQPSIKPNQLPSQQPLLKPSIKPSSSPSVQPTSLPTEHPSASPIQQPTSQPTSQPSRQPLQIPSDQPYIQPTTRPTYQPVLQPSASPTIRPTKQPDLHPSKQPLSYPSSQPITVPSQQPLRYPSNEPSHQPRILPSTQPFRQPTYRPSKQPVCKPTIQPISKPSMIPSLQPIMRPSSQPYYSPSGQPTSQPTEQPTLSPTEQPFRLPTTIPSRQPIIIPTHQPSNHPTIRPTHQPTLHPSMQPYVKPTVQPNFLPSEQPFTFPSSQPIMVPSQQPICHPSSNPSRKPWMYPTRQPLMFPSYFPSKQPVYAPSIQPYMHPTRFPSHCPSSLPSHQPSFQPADYPSNGPTNRPSFQPQSDPTFQPMVMPTMQPSVQPFCYPTNSPTKCPTYQPSFNPTSQPIHSPSTVPTLQPLLNPSGQPNRKPTHLPTLQPSSHPTNIPSPQPLICPTLQPNTLPSSVPSHQPMKPPTSQPSRKPNIHPSKQPSFQPISIPTSSPTEQSSRQPSLIPSIIPTILPSNVPSNQPSKQPTLHPSKQPSSQPIKFPSSLPTEQPFRHPSTVPSFIPSIQPFLIPSNQPSEQPSLYPSKQPFVRPSYRPSLHPTIQPSWQPNLPPTEKPTFVPSIVPSLQPIHRPTIHPSGHPSSQPTNQPLVVPSTKPSFQPTVFPSNQLTGCPTSNPSYQPTTYPTGQPASQPSASPTDHPSFQPFHQPTTQPSTRPSNPPLVSPSNQPFLLPTLQPKTLPTLFPSTLPSVVPTVQPTLQPNTFPSTQPLLFPTFQPHLFPSIQPSCCPTHVPSKQPRKAPTQQPSHQPFFLPSVKPSNQPIFFPTKQPVHIPSEQPISQPTILPLLIPSCIPSSFPTCRPSMEPNIYPSSSPSRQPSNIPSSLPTSPSSQPTSQPRDRPSHQPNDNPIANPSCQPSRMPTNIPSTYPSKVPSQQPSTPPSQQPTFKPSCYPTFQPGWNPSLTPASRPSQIPTLIPSGLPSNKPSLQPNTYPSWQPSNNPSMYPSQQPLVNPSIMPSQQPNLKNPSNQPTRQPLSIPSFFPTNMPSKVPSLQPFSIPTIDPTSTPSNFPSIFPTLLPSHQPSKQPYLYPTRVPSLYPTVKPSDKPTMKPFSSPSMLPSTFPTSQPLIQCPSIEPSVQPLYSPTFQPSISPSTFPTQQPIFVPSRQPQQYPTLQPTRIPTTLPTNDPTTQPHLHPTKNPNSQPSSLPSIQPRIHPTSEPTNQPNMQPTEQPRNHPTSHPSFFPSHHPTRQPLCFPTKFPSIQPKRKPSALPSSQPSTQPTFQPFLSPSLHPSSQPYLRSPTLQPATHPTSQPSNQPFRRPTKQPTRQPFRRPSCQPTVNPSRQPSGNPRRMPTCQPTLQPRNRPSQQPKKRPSQQPTKQPVIRRPSHQPSRSPTSQPMVLRPSRSPTQQPSRQPTRQPSRQPNRSKPTSQPSHAPTALPTHPTALPSQQPTSQPTKQPIRKPSRQPSRQPIIKPSRKPSIQPGGKPSRQSTTQPSKQPIRLPTMQPSRQPRKRPTSQPSRQPNNKHPSKSPTFQPSSLPSSKPTVQPFLPFPSAQPTNYPTEQPYCYPSLTPSCYPSSIPSLQQTLQPSRQPTVQPIIYPSTQPQVFPTLQPFLRFPTAQPSAQPNILTPSTLPTTQPSTRPSYPPTAQPLQHPTLTPSRYPLAYPTRQPSTQPNEAPSCQPVMLPSSIPSVQPTKNPSLVYAQIPLIRFAAPTSPLKFGNLTGVVYHNLTAISWYLQSLSSVYLQSYALKVSYVELLYQNYILGGCLSWSSAIFGDFLISGYYYEPKSLIISSLHGSLIGRKFQDYSSQYSTCNEPKKIKLILKRISSFSDLGYTNISCDRNIWIIDNCNSSTSLGSFPAICINCTNPCLPSSGLQLTPCVFNSVRSNLSSITASDFSVGYTVFGTTAPFISILDISSGNTSLSILAGLSKKGNLYCAAYLVDNLQPSTVDEVVAQGWNGNGSNTVIRLNVENLQALKTYSVYCVALSSNGVSTSNAQMLRDAVVVRTRCCKLLSVSISTRIINVNSLVSNFITVRISDLPSRNIQIKYVLLLSTGIDVDINSTLLSPYVSFVSPSTNTQILSFASNLNAFLSPGQYSYKVELGGLSAMEYRVEYRDERQFTVINSSLATSFVAPTIVWVTFSSDGTFIEVEFDLETNKAEMSDQFNCSLLFIFPGHSQSNCIWHSYSRIRIFIQANSDSICAVPGDILTIRNNSYIKLRNLNSIYCVNCYVISKDFIIRGPQVPTPPSVILSAPSTIDVNGSLWLDVSVSTGHAGRYWSISSVSVYCINGGNVENLEIFLRNNFQFHRPTIIPGIYFTEGYRYSFVVTLCNFLGACGQTSKVILALQTLVATITFPGSSFQSIYSYRDLWFRPLVLTSDGSPPSYSDLRFEWKVFQDNARNFKAEQYFKSTSPEVFFPKYSLSVNSVYRIDVTVSSKSILKSVSSAASAYITVLRGNICAVVAGGLNRTLFAANEIILDASQSYDEDIPSLFGIDAGLSFSWTCSQVSPVFSMSSCATFLSISTFNQSVSKIKRILSSTATFEIVLSINNYFASKSTSTTITIYSTNNESSTISLTSSSRSGIVLQYEYIQLLGVVQLVGIQNCNASWSMGGTTNEQSLKSVSASPLSVILHNRQNFSSHYVYLTIQPNSIALDGILKFSLSCYGSIFTPFASISLTMNAPPTPGSFYCHPTYGQQFEDYFGFNTQYWRDSDLPLSYQFGYSSLTNRNNRVVLQSRSFVSFANLQLPAGPYINNFTLQSVVEIFDYFLSNTTSESFVQVFPHNSVENVSALIGNIQATNAADYSLHALSISISIANAVPCNQAPNCTSLNRENCLNSPHTCGPCINDRFFGELGDSNDPCRRREQLPQLNTLSASKRQLAAITLPSNKSCPANCSGNGRCVFISKDSGLTVSSCHTFESFCEAVCNCYEGYVGTVSCYLSTVDLKSKQLNRLLSTTFIKSYIQSQHLDYYNHILVINQLNIVTQSLEELSLDVCTNLLELLQYVITVALSEDLILSLNSKQNIFMLISAVLSAIYAQYSILLSQGSETKATLNENFYAYLRTIQMLFVDYTHLVEIDMAPDNSPIEVIEESCRVISAAGTPQNSTIVTLPSTLVEQFNNITSSSIVLYPETPLSSSRYFDTWSALSCRSKYYYVFDKQINSNPVFLTSATNFSRGTISNMRLQYVLPTEIFMDTPLQTFETTCYTGRYREANFTCTDGSVLSVECNSSFDGTILSQCPMTAYQQFCSYSLLNESIQASIKNACPHVSTMQLSDGLTCLCPLSYDYNINLRPMNWTAYTAKVVSSTTIFPDVFLKRNEQFNNDIVYTVSSILLSLAFFFPYIRWGRKLQVNSKLKLASIVPVTEDDEPSKPEKVIKAAVVKFRQTFEQLIPHVFRANSSWKLKILREMQLYHKVYRVFSPLLTSPRLLYLNIISLISETVLMMFLVTFFFVVLNNEHSRCRDISIQETCTNQFSSLFDGVVICDWLVDQRNQVSRCEFIHSAVHMTVRVVVAVLVVSISTSSTVLIDSLIMRCSVTTPTLFTKISSISADSKPSGYEEDNLAYFIADASVKDEIVVFQIRQYLAAFGMKETGVSTIARKSIFSDSGTFFLIPHMQDPNILHRYFGGNTAIMMKWLCADLKGMVSKQKSFGNEGNKNFIDTIESTRLRKRIFFYLQHILLTNLDGAVFRSKSVRDCCRLSPLSRLHSIVLLVMLATANGGMIAYTISFSAKHPTAMLQRLWVWCFLLSCFLNFAAVTSLHVLLIHVTLPHSIAEQVNKQVLFLARLAAYGDALQRIHRKVYLALQHRTDSALLRMVWINVLQLPLCVLDIGCMILLTIFIGVLLASSILLFNMFPLLALIPWIAIYISLYMASKLIWNPTNKASLYYDDSSDLTVEKSTTISTSNIVSNLATISVAEAAKNGSETPNRNKRETIVEKILSVRQPSIVPSSKGVDNKAVSAYKFRYLDYQRRHTQRSTNAGTAMGPTAQSRKRLTTTTTAGSGVQHNSKGKKSLRISTPWDSPHEFLHLPNNFIKEESDNCLSAMDSLYIDFYQHVDEDEEPSQESKDYENVDDIIEYYLHESSDEHED